MNSVNNDRKKQQLLDRFTRDVVGVEFPTIYDLSEAIENIIRKHSYTYNIESTAVSGWIIYHVYIDGEECEYSVTFDSFAAAYVVEDVSIINTDRDV